MAIMTYEGPLALYTGATGSAVFTGAGAVMTLDAPDALSNALPSNATKMLMSIEGGTIHVTTDGKTPTATAGIAYTNSTFLYTGRAGMVAWKMYVPAGVVVNVEYFPGLV